LRFFKKWKKHPLSGGRGYSKYNLSPTIFLPAARRLLAKIFTGIRFFTISFGT
jgi:hypothetical protein